MSRTSLPTAATSSDLGRGALSREQWALIAHLAARGEYRRAIELLRKARARSAP